MTLDLKVDWQNKLILIILIIVSSTLISAYFHSHKFSLSGLDKISISPPNQYSCSGRLIDGPVFKVYSEGNINSARLTDALCKNLADKVSQVVVLWELSSDDILLKLKGGEFDLVMGRVHLVESYYPSHLQDYQPIGYYPAHSANLLSLDNMPSLSDSYLNGKKIGLLKNDKSLSGHNIPLKVFRDAGHDIKALNLNFFDSHFELRTRLFREELDVIASYWDASDLNENPNLKRLELNNQVESSRWYLRAQWANEFQCDIQAALLEAAKESENVFLRKLKVGKSDCRD